MRRLGLVSRSLLVSAATLAAVAGGWAVLGRFWPLLAGPVAALLGYTLFAPVAAASHAVADGLLAYAENDTSLRLAAGRAHDPEGLVARFNALGTVLRAGRSDAYQKELMLETVLRATPTAMLLENQGGRVVYANGTARELLGGGEALEGRALADIVAEAEPELGEALMSPQDALFAVDRDGERQVYDVARRTFHINTQRHRLIMIRPLGRQLARQEAEAWKKAIRVVSHEVGNSLAPVTSLMHSARKLAEGPEAAARLTKVFDIVEERLAHLRAFLEGFAGFARLPRPAPRAVDWAPFLDGVRALFAFTTSGALPERPGWFDPGQMQQVLINLLKNAVEAGSPESETAISVSEGAGGVTLEVLDRGRGLSAEVRENALLPFYSTKRTGSGLGLSLAREIVDAHGGRLSLHEREDGGTVVRLWLPGAPEE